MAATNSYESNYRYRQKAYETYSLTFRKGERERLKSYAAAQGLSFNAWILQAVYKAIGEEPPTLDRPGTPADDLPTQDSDK